MSWVSGIAVGVGAIGGVAGIVTLLQFFNTFKAVKKKTRAEAESAMDDFHERRLHNARKSIDRLEAQNVRHQEQNESLMDLVRDLLRFLAESVPHDNDEDIDNFQSRLTEIRRMTLIDE